MLQKEGAVFVGFALSILYLVQIGHWIPVIIIFGIFILLWIFGK